SGSNEWNLGLGRRNAGAAQRRAMIDGRKECRTVIVNAAVGERGANRDKGGQVVVLGTQPIPDPRAHARAGKGVAPRVQFEQRAAVPRVRAMHTVQKTYVVDSLGNAGKQLADPGTALAVLAEFPGAGQQVAGFRRHHAWLAERKRLAVVARQ